MKCVIGDTTSTAVVDGSAPDKNAALHTGSTSLFNVTIRDIAIVFHTAQAQFFPLIKTV